MTERFFLDQQIGLTDTIIPQKTAIDIFIFCNVYIFFADDRLIQLVDTLGLKLEVMGVSGMLSSTSLVLAIKTVDGTNFPETSVEIFNTDNVQVRQRGVWPFCLVQPRQPL